MTNPVHPTAGIAPSPAIPLAPKAAAAPQAPAFTVEVSRGMAGPVYVYRVTDTATGRILVEIPNDPEAPAHDAPGAKLDAKA